jgi:zinc transport system substrate-binding protein
MNKYIKMGTLFSAALFSLFGCGAGDKADTASGDGKLTVVTTFYPMYDFTKQVVGDKGNVTLLLKAGQDSHGYEPTPKDIAAIADADVFVYNSDEMETWVPSVLDSIGNSDVVVVDASKDIPLYQVAEGDPVDEAGDAHSVDPHVWLDPVYAQDEVAAILVGVTKADAANKAFYEANAASFQGKLAALDIAYQTAFANAENRTFVVQHAAFGYIARRYNLTEMAVSSVSSDAEPNPAKLAELKQFMIDNHIGVVYYSDNASSKTAETLAGETGAALEVLSPLEGISQEEQDAGKDYLSVMQDNLAALQKTIH